MRLRRRFWEEPRIDRAYPAWVARRKPLSRPLVEAPRISVLMPVHETRESWLRAAIDSVRRQTFGNWELCVADDASKGTHVAAILGDAAMADSRIRVTRLETRQGIAGATNAAGALADGDYVAFLDHDDVLAPQALAAMAEAARQDTGAGLLFSDEDQIVEGRLRAPYFKPGWNPDLLLQQNLVCHFAMCRHEVFAALGGMRAGFEGAQDHDFALRAWALLGDAGVRHVPGVLYHWRQETASFSARDAARCRAASARAVEELAGEGARLLADAELPGWVVTAFAPGEARARTAVLRPGAAAEPAEVLVFLSDAARPATEDAIDRLVGQVLRPGVGIAGGRLGSGAGGSGRSRVSRPVPAGACGGGGFGRLPGGAGRAVSGAGRVA